MCNGIAIAEREREQLAEPIELSLIEQVAVQRDEIGKGESVLARQLLLRDLPTSSMDTDRR